MKFIKSRFNKLFVTTFLSFSLMVSSFTYAFADSTSLKDIHGNWAEETINQWVSQNLIHGYPDATFKPNQPIKRVELISLINKSFKFITDDTITYQDIHTSDWYYKDVAIAHKAGYASGYSDGTFKPNKNISRQEFAVIVSRLLSLAPSSSSDQYTDTKNSPSWSMGAIGAVIDKKIMNGFPDQTFGPTKYATRAEAVVILDRAIKLKQLETTTTYNKAGVFGPNSGQASVNNDVIINTSGVVLQNMKINGNLLIAAGVGEGSVTLKNVTVTGTTTVNGGGTNSVHFENSVLFSLAINKKTGSVRIVVEGSTEVKQATIESSAKLETSNNTGNGFDYVVLSSKLPNNANVNLVGTFNKVEVNSTETQIDVSSGQIKKLYIQSNSNHTKISVGQNAKIVFVELNAPATISGSGEIDEAVINVIGVSIAQDPTQLTIKVGVSVIINGQKKTSADNTGNKQVSGVTSGGSSGGSGSGSSGSTSLSSNLLFSQNITVKGNGSVTLDRAPVSGETAWFAPNSTSVFLEGSTMTKLIGDGSTKTILAPSMGAEYKLYLMDSSGAISSASSATLTVDNSAPTDQDTFLMNSQTVKGGSSIALASAPAIGEIAWLAPATTTTFAKSTIMTKLVGDGSTKQMIVPSAESTYKLFILDSVGNASNPSAKDIVVDNTAPADQDSVFATDITIKGNLKVSLNTVPASGETAWFAPAATTQFVEGPTMTKMNNGAIFAPASVASYKLFLIDSAGNVSAPSAATLTVENSIPTDQNTVLTSSQIVKDGATITLNQSPVSGETPWLAPASTTSFVEGATITKGSGSTILSPSTDAVYCLFLVDNAGNVSAPSTATITVDNTPPTNQDAVFSGSQSVSPGATITLNGSLASGETAWFAPATSTQFTVGVTMASSTGSTIIAPTQPAVYKLFIIDAAGNVSNPSNATLTVQ